MEKIVNLMSSEFSYDMLVGTWKTFSNSNLVITEASCDEVYPVNASGKYKGYCTTIIDHITYKDVVEDGMWQYSMVNKKPNLIMIFKWPTFYDEDEDILSYYTCGSVRGLFMPLGCLCGLKFASIRSRISPDDLDLFCVTNSAFRLFYHASDLSPEFSCDMLVDSWRSITEPNFVITEVSCDEGSLVNTSGKFKGYYTTMVVDLTIKRTSIDNGMWRYEMVNEKPRLSVMFMIQWPNLFGGEFIEDTSPGCLSRNMQGLLPSCLCWNLQGLFTPLNHLNGLVGRGVCSIFTNDRDYLEADANVFIRVSDIETL